MNKIIKADWFGRRVTAILILCLLLCFGQTAIGMEPGAEEDPLKQGVAQYLVGRQLFYNAEGTFAEAKETLLAAKPFFLQLPAGAEQYCWLAKVEFLIAELEEARGDRRSAQQAFTESERWAEQALEANKSSSIAHQLLADAYMRLMDYKSALYTANKGPQALKLLNTAVSLDSKNYPAFISLATYYLNAPAIAGGSLKKGVKALEKALRSTDEHDLFLSNLWLGVAYRKLKKEDKAQGYFLKALAIYPQSPWAKEWMNERK
ncbi:MAG TPA: hypothetical protein DD734_03620 [Firmicutes bacterium]|nr:hypothetical protein [Bacillota bacterium]HBR33697.1 hypothetical protein [Bacillota bacterium]